MKYKRVVMVQFNNNMNKTLFIKYIRALHFLKEQATGLCEMEYGALNQQFSEKALNKNSPDVFWGDFVSIWEFESEVALNDFINADYHKHIAKTLFSQLVKKRFVINVKIK